GLFSSIGVLCMGGSIITLEERNFDPVELWETAARQRATQVAIVGDAFAKPLLRALDDNRGRWDLSAMLLIVSSGVMWSQEVKQGLISHIPQVTLLDAFGASEAVGFAMSATTKEGEVATGKFMMGTDVAVFTPDRRRVTPGSGEPGFIARGGNIPLGYWQDPEKSAKTFPVIEGRRWSMPGDFCLLHEDGSITLLGRGSACINTAGEKVYPEEVEEALKQHPGVEDALVVGVPDEKWGSAVTAIVQKAPGASFTEDELRAHVRARLAGYKTPKRILEVHQMFRAPNGKADYRQATSFARSSLGLPL
ncbi:MAG: AMP-binding enzyme, partial [Alphaproteobacteria bacterium]